MTKAGPGIVQLDVRRTWDVEAPGEGAPLSSRAMPVRRIIGNGIVWDQEGRILTVADLAQPGDTIRVVWKGGGSSPANFLGQDPDLGLSLIQAINPPPVQPIPKGEASTLQRRGWVLTLTCRGDSPTKRLAVARLGNRLERSGSIRIHLDGSGDPGFAGGGVLDEEGRLLGILLGEGTESLLLNAESRRRPVEYSCQRSGGPTEAGWLLTIDQIQKAATAMLLAPNSAQGFLGVRIPVPAEAMEEAGGPGLAMAGVMPGSPAARAGIRPGDRLVGFEGERVESWDDVTHRVAAAGPGKLIKLDLQRGGRSLTVHVRLGDRGHTIWRQKQREIADGRERTLTRQIEGLSQQLELLRHQLAQTR